MSGLLFQWRHVCDETAGKELGVSRDGEVIVRRTCPYHPQAWCKALEDFNLSCRYLHIPECLKTRFSGGIPIITHMYTPFNQALASVTIHAEAIQKSLILNSLRAISFKLVLMAEVFESIIGPFQTSPLSIILKPGSKPGKFNTSFKTCPTPSTPGHSVLRLVAPSI
jgi:hypothetical protein